MIRVVGSASRASAAGSSTAVRATTRPTAAAATAAGTAIRHMEPNWPGSTRPWETLMTANMQRLPTTVATITPTSAASHDQLSDSGTPSTDQTVAATLPVTPNRAVLKASLRPRCLRCTNRAAATPTSWATTTWGGRGEHEAGGQHQVADREGVRVLLDLDVDGEGLAHREGHRPHHPRQGHGCGWCRQRVDDDGEQRRRHRRQGSREQQDPLGHAQPHRTGRRPEDTVRHRRHLLLVVADRQAQSAPDQLTPDQLTPLQLTPDQLTPDQLTPDQLTPDQLTPDQLTPFQLVPPRMPLAKRVELNAVPRMSISPRTWRPPTFTCTDPRASSREPWPVDTLNDCTLFGVLAVMASVRSTRPGPC